MRAATKYAKQLHNAEMISIHAAHAGSDQLTSYQQSCTKIFQSTLPMRAATYHCNAYQMEARNFNPRCPCGQRRTNACI